LKLFAISAIYLGIISYFFGKAFTLTIVTILRWQSQCSISFTVFTRFVHFSFSLILFFIIIKEYKVLEAPAIMQVDTILEYILIFQLTLLAAQPEAAG